MFSKMCSKKLLVLCLYLMILNCSYGQREKKFFRKDYKYFEDSQSFYKLHKERKTWADAKKICALEGATFFYPDSTQASFMSWWNSTEGYDNYYIGVSSFPSKGVFETIDGRSILDVYNKWSEGQPDHYNNAEDCLEIRRTTGTLNDVECTRELPFICKKTLASLEWNEQCNSPNLDYHYDEEFDRCYKFHTTPLPWPEAHFVCAGELSYLAVPNSQREADLLVNITASEERRIKSLKNEVLGTVHLGFHNRMGDGWQTFGGSSLYDSGNTKWAPNQLDGEVREQCGSMFYNGTLKDINCKTRSLFLCEHEIDDDGQRDKKFFRKDYSYIEDTQSFYKIHTLRKTWADAKKTCALEGATFFYPENTLEAATVISWWNARQPFNNLFIGVSDLLAKGVFETIDGTSILDVYNAWAPGEPNDANGGEDCVVIRRDTGTLNDDKCTNKLPFICKKTLVSLEWNQQCNSPNLDYQYDGEFGRCYKFHTTPLPWPEAHVVCAAEQSYLAVPNSQREADLLVNITASTPKDHVKGPFLSGAVHLGLHDRMGDGWQTVKGTYLYDSGYTKWAPNQPDGEGREQCGSMFYNGSLNDIECKNSCFFICEHEIDILSTSYDDRFGVETVAS